MSKNSYHNGAAHESEHHEKLLNINSYRPLNSPPITLIQTPRFTTKYQRCLYSKTHHYSAQNLAQSSLAAERALLFLRQKESFFESCWHFGGQLRLDAPSDTDCSLTDDVRDIIIDVCPNTLFTSTGHLFENTTGLSTRIGLSLKRNSSERRAARAGVFEPHFFDSTNPQQEPIDQQPMEEDSSYDDQNIPPSFVFPGTILGIPPHLFQEQSEQLGSYIQQVVGVVAKHEPAAYKQFLITHSIHILKQCTQTLTSAQSIQALLNRQLGAYDYYTMGSYTNTKTPFLQCLTNQRFGTLGAFINNQGIVFYPKPNHQAPTALQHVELLLPKQNTLNSASIQCPLRRQYMQEHGYQNYYNALRLYFDNGYILDVRFHNGNTILGYSMIKCSTTFFNETLFCPTSRIYAQQPSKTLEDPNIDLQIIPFCAQTLREPLVFLPHHS